MYWLVIYYGLSPQIIEDGNLGLDNPPQTYEMCIEKALRVPYDPTPPWGIQVPIKIMCQWGSQHAWEYRPSLDPYATP